MQSQKHRPRIYSFEFFPPRDPQASANLREAGTQLLRLDPGFVSVTYGAGGSTRQGTYETVKALGAQGFKVAPHLSCIGAGRASLVEQIQAYRSLGVRQIVALGGDLPSGMASPGEFRYAYQLVELIRAETGGHFHIEVACYPEVHPRAASAEDDLRHFQQKIASGANSALTQYFYNAEAYFRFVDECESLGLDIPIVPGIMPITNYKQLARFSDNCGAEIPRWIRKRLESYGDDLESIRAFGLDVTTELCAKLLAAGAPGLHFYTMNRAGPTCAIWERLSL
ncbi:MAG: methylenetetrahydrofolate reductase [NAD(P)H] [Sulfurifustaceae bacterium]